jgi:hypothetical protein
VEVLSCERAKWTWKWRIILSILDRFVFAGAQMPEASSDPPSWYFRPVEVESHYTEYALVLVGYDGERSWALGSAVFIAPDLIMTAKHVTEEAWRSSGRSRRDSVGTQTPFAMIANHFLGETSELITWQAKGFWASRYTDVSFITVVPANDAARLYKPVKVPVSNVQPPRVGEYVFGIGYPSTRILGRDEDETQIGVSPHITRGRVTEVYLDYRDRGMLNFPCFEINTRFDGGMSGGPLFNESGQLCGLICASRTGEPVSWGVTLWPAMSTLITHTPDGEAIPEPFPVWALGRAGHIEMHGYTELQSRIYEEVDPFGKRSLHLKPED